MLLKGHFVVKSNASNEEDRQCHSSWNPPEVHVLFSWTADFSCFDIDILPFNVLDGFSTVKGAKTLTKVLAPEVNAPCGSREQ